MTSYKPILPPATIGIIGGGQLGRMIAISARQMGYGVVILDPTPRCPAAMIADAQIIADYDDLEALRQLYDVCDVLTYEFENIPAYSLENILDRLPQGSFPLAFTQDRLLEKETINRLGFKTVPFVKIDNNLDLFSGVKLIGLPAILKTRHGGYDGKGQVLIEKEADIEKVTGLSILESKVDIFKEVSLIVCRNCENEIKTFPVIENIHKDQRLVESSIPTTIDSDMIAKIESTGKKLCEELNIVGTMTLEFFITAQGEVLINECAPRVHNSGHLTIEGCNVSQFEQHLRAILNLPLKDTKIIKPTLMINIYGQDLSVSREILSKNKTINYHLYGKEKALKNRKIGHITICKDDLSDLEIERLKFREILNKDI
jgi:5-(carboxyamino)imidazole ribonucleotide synthase